MLELDEQIRRLIDGCAPPVTIEDVTARSGDGSNGSPERQRSVVGGAAHRPRLRLAAAVVTVVLVAGLAAVATVGVRSHRPASTSPKSPRAPSWQLAADLSPTDFQLASGGPAGGVSDVACGGATCFLSTFYGVGGNTALTGSTYVSHDAGHTWEPTVLPTGVATATSVSCVTATWCAAGGGLLDPSTGDPAAKKELRDPELLTTDDAGATWTMHAVPVPPDVQQLPAYESLPAETTYWPGIVDAVACTAPGVCDVLAHVLNNNDQTGGLIPDSILFLRTTDGGDKWTSAVLPETAAESGFEEMVPNGNGGSLACPTASRCIAVSVLDGFGSAAGDVDVWRTSDSGSSWHETRIAGVYQVSHGISCPDPTECWIPTGGGVLRSTDGGATWTIVPTPSVLSAQGQPSDGWQAVSCTSAKACVLGGPGLVVTSDGGATWSTVTPPKPVGAVLSVSCGLHGSCIALAQPALTPGQVIVPNGGSMILTDGPAPSTGSDPT